MTATDGTPVLMIKGELTVEIEIGGNLKFKISGNWVEFEYGGKHTMAQLRQTQDKEEVVYVEDDLFKFNNMNIDLFSQQQILWTSIDIEENCKQHNIQVKLVENGKEKWYIFGMGEVDNAHDIISDYYEYEEVYEYFDEEYWNDLYDYYYGYLSQVIEYVDSYLEM